LRIRRRESLFSPHFKVIAPFNVILSGINRNGSSDPS
jgi:hypothetical protein